VAYYTLLSLVPLFLLLLVALSHLVDQRRLLDTLASALELLIADQSTLIIEQVEAFLAHRYVVGLVGFAVLLFFSAIAFTVLENAMAVIFHHRGGARRRHFLVSAILPYLFIMLVGVGLLLVTLISGALDSARGSIRVLGHVWAVAGATRALLYALGVVGLALLLTALYMVLPAGGISFRHALVGGVTATALWEVTRHVLVWYFARLSMVNMVYGSLAAAIVVLLTLEAASLILLLGAQMIAEVDRTTAAMARRPRRGAR
jgi:YihY family inner membrane protein